MLPINRSQANLKKNNMENQFYIPQFFKPEELVSKDVYERLKKLGKLEIIWTLFDWRVLKTLDFLRAHYNEPITVNNWMNGGNLQQCGLRWDDTTQGAEFSQHKFGRAADNHFSKTTAEKVREDCLKNPFAEPFQYITCIEAGVSWFHFDVRNWDKTTHGILVVKP